MKKKILIAFTVLLIVFTAQAQSNKQDTLVIDASKVKAIKVNGKVIPVVYLQGSIISITQPFYDDLINALLMSNSPSHIVTALRKYIDDQIAGKQ